MVQKAQKRVMGGVFFFFLIWLSIEFFSSFLNVYSFGQGYNLIVKSFGLNFLKENGR